MCNGDHHGEDQTPPQHVGDEAEPTEDKQENQRQYEQHHNLLGFRA